MTETSLDSKEEKVFLNGSPYLVEFKPVFFDWTAAIIIAKKNYSLTFNIPISSH